ncbi:prepilin peptidase-dependent protein [Orbus sturtevantii]|uniref:prepilin peptidase-dependent protein n=1 Tax=Orbus sturtevantii TaxID=3074109 RepID=UPI00370DB48A
MLNRGFSLFEMLLSLALTSLIMLSIVAFYPKFNLAIIKIYQQNRLEEATNQALYGLIKDIRRAGFIANSKTNITKPAIEINSTGDCIILRYDATSSGKWRYDLSNPQRSDVFAYRYYKNSLDAQSGINNCHSTQTRWDKLFDPNEIDIIHFQAKQYLHYTELNIAVQLKHYPTARYQAVYYVKNQNS